jgi:hypothetical protein
MCYRQINSLIAYAKRPLKLVELQEALAISQKSFQDVNLLDLTAEDIEELDGNRVQYDCAPFVGFRPCQEGSKDGYLRLSHSSAFQFLLEPEQRSGTVAEEVCVSPNLISEVCLKYLSQRRYRKVRLNDVRTHHFYTYAAKYWHKHTDEADLNPSLLQAVAHLMRSPQFLTLTQFQSFLLDRHFANNLVDERNKNRETDFRSSSINVPQCLGTEADMQSLVEDYQHFIKEWGHFLKLGVDALESSGIIEQCFWSALGKQNFLRTHGSEIEKNSSFLLEMNIMAEEMGQDEGTLHKPCFYETISEDGSRMAVWKTLAQRYNYPLFDHRNPLKFVLMLL